MSNRISDMRISYTMGHVDDNQLNADPFVQFRIWFDEASQTNVAEANAMIVSTVDADGMPDARTILMKGFDRNGIVFFTNYESAKGRQLAANPAVCLLFYWPTLQRQVRWRGNAQRVSPQESDEYFHSRPRGSQLGSASSPQSQPIANRDVLGDRYAALEADYAGQDEIPRPDWWGGFRVVPISIEFWQGRENRLHDRFLYTQTEAGAWVSQRLAP